MIQQVYLTPKPRLRNILIKNFLAQRYIKISKHDNGSFLLMKTQLLHTRLALSLHVILVLTKKLQVC